MDLKGSDFMTDQLAPALSCSEVLVFEPNSLSNLTSKISDLLNRVDCGVVAFDLRADSSPQGSATTREVTRWERGLRSLERSSVTSIAVLGPTVHGPLLELALACDVRIACPRTRIVFRDGSDVWPSAALYRLVHLVGAGAARRAVLIDGSSDAAQALAVGLVDRIAADQWSVVESIAADVGNIADLRVVRQLLGEAPSTSYEEAIGAHLAACDRFLRRKDGD